MNGDNNFGGGEMPTGSDMKGGKGDFSGGNGGGGNMPSGGMSMPSEN
jgi:hypothetical protein